MTGDCHVRFCKGLGARLLRPTNLLARPDVCAVTDRGQSYDFYDSKR